MLFDEVGAAELIHQYQAAPTSSCLNRIVKAFQPLVFSLIPLPPSHAEYDDLAQEGLIKVVALIPKWSQSKGKAYSFFSTSIKNRYNSILSGKTFNNKVDLVPVENLDAYAHHEMKSPEDVPWQTLPSKLDHTHWRTQDPTLYRACDWYRDCLAEGVGGREKTLRTMCLLFDMTPADAEFVIGLVTVTLRQKLVMYDSQ